MRALVLTLLSLFAVTNVFADAFAGKTHILLEGREPHWVPIEGGEATPLVTTSGVSLAAAYDGENFLVVSTGEENRVLASMYAEGAREPFRTITLEEEPGGLTAVVTWDGTRYVAAWSRTFGSVRGATITGDGAVTYFEMPGFMTARSIASNGSQILIAEMRYLRDAQPQTRTIEAAILGANLEVRKEFTLASIEASPQWAHDQAHLSTIDSIAFNNGFYIVASRGDGFGNDQILGMRVRSDGTITDRTILDRNASRVYDVDLIPSGKLLMAIMKRHGLFHLTATYIARSGATLGPQPISPRMEVDGFDPQTRPSAVRLPNGRVAFVAIENGFGIVTPVRDRPRLPWAALRGWR